MNDEKIEVLSRKLKIVEYHDAYAVVPKGQGNIHIFDNERNFVPYTSKRRMTKSEYAVPDIEESDFLKEEIEYLDEDVIYIGSLIRHYGHFIVDSSVRLWALNELGNKCRVLVKIDGMNEFYTSLFHFLGIEETRIIDLDRTKKFRNVFVPEISYLPSNYIAREFLWPFEEVIKNVNLDKPIYEKIYLSRLHFSRGKREFGEKSVQKIFEMNGYYIIYPEETPFEEQVWYYKNCNLMVTSDGTIEHNILFAKKGTKLVVLNQLSKGKMHQGAINTIKNVEAVEIDVSDKYNIWGKVLMCRTKELLDFCRANDMYIPKEFPFTQGIKKGLFRMYVWIGLCRKEIVSWFEKIRRG